MARPDAARDAAALGLGRDVAVGAGRRRHDRSSGSQAANERSRSRSRSSCSSATAPGSASASSPSATRATSRSVELNGSGYRLTTDGRAGGRRPQARAVRRRDAVRLRAGPRSPSSSATTISLATGQPRRARALRRAGACSSSAAARRVSRRAGPGRAGRRRGRARRPAREVRWFADREPHYPRTPLRRRLYKLAYPAVGYGPPPLNRLVIHPDLFAALPESTAAQADRRASCAPAARPGCGR